jgi:hypothetical protein
LVKQAPTVPAGRVLQPPLPLSDRERGVRVLRRFPGTNRAPGRPAGRGGFTRGAVVVVLALVAVVGSGARPALAHDSVEDALARGEGPPDWVYQLGAWTSVMAMLVVGVLAFRRLWLGSGPALRFQVALAQLLALWLLLGFVQSGTARTIGTPIQLYVLGKVVFPLAIIAVWALVLANFGGTLRLALRGWRYRALAVGIALVTAGFYLWAGNLIAPPEPHDMPPPGTEAFVIVAPVYGPLAIWSAVEFWLPQIPLFGALSLGTGLVIGTIAALMGLTWTAMLSAVRLQRQRSRGQNAKMGGVGGLGAASASFCCCCAPAVYPVLALVFGTTAASSISTWMLGSSSPFYNMSMVGMIAIILWALNSVCTRIKRIAAITAATCTAPVCETPEPAGSPSMRPGKV